MKGECVPLVAEWYCDAQVAFTPKGGCPLKECHRCDGAAHGVSHVAFTPKGGCPLKCPAVTTALIRRSPIVAFTPKGGCPLKYAW